MRFADGLPLAVDFAKGAGLVPAIVQDSHTGAVLMLGYMNREALDATIERGVAVFWSRSKGRLWQKGETSGHVLKVLEIQLDCDRDTLLLTATPTGPACHLGTTTCFGDAEPSRYAAGFLGMLESVIEQRIAERAEGSYTSRLHAAGPRRIAQKVGEEGVEVALAGAGGDASELCAESADLLYHLLVLLRARGVAFGAVVEELASRHGSREAVR